MSCDDEVAKCVEFLNTEFKKTKFKEMKRAVIEHGKSLSKYIDIKDYEGHDPNLVK